MKVSRCCQSTFRTEWVTTRFYVCDNCNTACDVYENWIKTNFAHLINQSIQKTKQDFWEDFNISDIHDWYHSFWELYKHRFALYIALCSVAVRYQNELDWCLPKKPNICIRSKIHEDWLNVWEEWGMFLLCLHTPDWQISYHLDKEYWDKCDFAETQEKATIPFDWHTSDDVLERLLKL